MAEEQLQSISKIFIEKLFRIPDYQRGYSWGKKQLNEFWDDLEQLNDNKNHYTGVITLEKVPESTYQNWADDCWIIDSKSYEPFYVVDGQQRLTTIIILIQCIIEKIGEDGELNYNSVKDIRKKFIFESKDAGISRSYIFGYEKDNPSYEYLKTRIFKESSTSDLGQETLYTNNLLNAKIFFQNKIENLSNELIQKLYRKLTQKLLFNVYNISNEIDVFITFETMNNRGKKLSNLELLKNRLIYLSTLFDDDYEKGQLRKDINECWKTVYEYLGKNKDKPLDDDEFLKNHWIVYYQYSRKTSEDYINFLLDKKFTTKNIFGRKNNLESNYNENSNKISILDNGNSELEVENDYDSDDMTIGLTIEEIHNYVVSLKESVKCWYMMFNPYNCNELSNEEKIWLDKLNRLGFVSFAPLIMAVYCKKIDVSKKIELFKSVERYNFLVFIISQVRRSTGDSEFNRTAKKLYWEEENIEQVIEKIDSWTDYYFDIDLFEIYIDKKFERGEGYYSWNGLRYFLFEYELHLKDQSKTNNQKIDWNEFITNKKDFITIEHIYPQTPEDKYWTNKYKKYDDDEKYKLCNSLGNLLPLSVSKNSSLQNVSFLNKKVDTDKQKGYFNGSYSENKVALKEDWTAIEIKERGIELLNFLEENWDIEVGDNKFKAKLLNIDFVK